MINMFWDDDDWQIATRNQVGGYNWFYERDKTFRYLFLDCLHDQFDFENYLKGLRITYCIFICPTTQGKSYCG